MLSQKKVGGGGLDPPIHADPRALTLRILNKHMFCVTVKYASELVDKQIDVYKANYEIS